MPVGLSLTLALYSHFPVDDEVGAFVEAMQRDGEAADLADGLGGLEWLHRGGEEDERATGFHAVGEGFLLHRHREIVAAGGGAGAQVFADAGDLALTTLDVVAQALSAGSAFGRGFRRAAF